MFTNYIKIAWRNLFKYKAFSFINIFGLALGTICCLYIVLYVKNEFSYDDHHAHADQIYRITSEMINEGVSEKMGTTSPPIPGAMVAEFPEVEMAARFVNPPGVDQHVLRYEDRSFYETNGVYADPDFFKIFSFHFIYGEPKTALANPYNLVLSRETATKLFGNENPIGKTVVIDNQFGKNDFNVTGVFDESLGKSHIQANFFMSMNSGGVGDYVLNNDEWVGNNFTNAYVKLRPNTSVAQLENKLPAFLVSHAGEKIRERGDFQKILHLQPVREIHTTAGYTVDQGQPVSKTLLYILLAIAGLVQLIACINFMNLATARSVNRAKEIGIRKVAGANRGLLIGQFLSESMLMAVIAMFIAVPTMLYLMPYLNQITGADLSTSLLDDVQIWMLIIGLGLLTGLLAGSYPALYLSGFKPIQVLRKQLSNFGGNVSLRKALVVFQFVLAIALIIGVIGMNQQMAFIQQKDLGFEAKQKVIVPFRTNEARQQGNAFRSEALQVSGIQHIARANNYPSQFVFNDQNYYTEGSSLDLAKIIKFMFADEYFVKALDIQILKGRDFQPTDGEDKVIVNEAVLNSLGIPMEEAIGQRLYANSGEDLETREIVGVMQNFNFNALYDEVAPFMLRHSNEDWLSQSIIDVEAENYEELLGQLEIIWQRTIPSAPFSYAFLDEDVGQLYEADQRLASIINSFTILAILISCLGLFGLAMFTAQQRTKEIGIRKVLGASIADVAVLLSKDFIKLVLIAVILASPLAWWGMDAWLSGFAYRIEMQWWMFALAGAAALAVALLTVSWQAIRSALANPVDSLRSE